MPSQHPGRPTGLNNLAIAMYTQFEQLGRMPDLEGAIMLHREALHLRPPGHPDRSTSLNNLAVAMHTEFEQLGKMSNLKKAIALHRVALKLRPPGHPNRSKSLSNLAIAVLSQFKQLGNMSDLKEAIMLHREALKLNPPGHPERSSILNYMAIAVHTQFKQLGEMSDLEEAINFELASEYIYAGPTIRLKYTLTWAKLAHQYRHKSAGHAYRKALLLLEQCLTIFPTPQLQHSFFQTVPRISELASNAVSCAIESGDLKEAVEVWEQGRGILWSKMRAYRYPIEQLKSQNAVLAEQFENVTLQLDQLTTMYDSGSQSSGSHVFEKQLKTKRQLNKRWNDLIKEIQSSPGFQTFLTIPSFSNIKRVASEGPVILVNISQHHSDALILFNVDSDPINVPLPDTAEYTVFEIVSCSSLAHSSQVHDDLYMDETINKVLKHLWKYIVCHIFQRLEDLGLAENSRIWWCLSGKLCALPIHAAQPFLDPQQKLSQKYIHSYTSTLSSLIRAREGIEEKERGITPRILAMATSSLEKVYEEIEVVQNVGCDVQKLIGSQVTHSTVLDGLAKSPWFHFASHGHLDTKQPFKSSIELHDNARFTILDLMKANLPNAELAVLSACHTAAVDQDNTPDEGISLAAGMQFCGFRGVVGTVGAMDDHIGPFLAKEFYKRMLHLKNRNKPVDFRDAAKCLRAVTRKMRRDEEFKGSHCWVPLVHIGA
ncbi:hypothetical protein FA95DRAFT_1550329 [Auriscalpium vulgare]|uniref:Uncharacterized protein n=1 Tax=Auriscalpium vulgare TaxID=40419 RepID=A0ACB8R7S9_9AGAM|nr:hypothetical protein FA95DRAFT_1550329 [Auriscalpium vulgare]